MAVQVAMHVVCDARAPQDDGPRLSRAAGRSREFNANAKCCRLYKPTSAGRIMSQVDANVLILTPMKSAHRFLDGYFAGLRKLSYPRQRLSIGILESDSRDDTFTQVKARLAAETFRRVTLVKKDFGFHMPSDTPRY